MDSEPTLGNGKICYLHIPALDAEKSAQFYHDVFGWNIRRRDNGDISFDDGVNQVSGAWIVGVTPDPEPGILIYIMVDDMQSAISLLLDHGGKLVQPVGADAPEITARFSDPAGNVFGLYQEPT